MELNDAILGRRSIRAFLPEQVPRGKILQIIEMARWVPSWGNTQPWEIVVADGEKAKELTRRFYELGKAGTPPRPDFEMPLQFPEPYKSRYTGLGKDLLTHLGIARDDREGRMEHYLRMYRFFGAPACIYFLVDGRMNVPYTCLDIGSIGSTICTVAVQHGLGSIFLALSMHYPDVIREVLDIPEEMKVLIGIAIGVPDPKAPGSIFRSTRAPVDEIVRFA